MTQPNILFFMTDQQRADALGCSGGWLKTPHLDRIAREGVRFTRCVTTTPICVPARVTLATGRYPHNNAVWNNLQYTMPEDASTWMRVIRDLGYRTSLFGKTHLHPHGDVDLREREYLLHAYGLDDVNEIGGPRASAKIGSHMTAMWEEKGLLEAYRTDFKERFDNKPHVVRPSVLPLELYYDVYVGQCAKRYLEAYDREAPWFCWVSFGGPHEPWDTPEPYASMYEPDAMPTPTPRAPDDHDRPRGWLDEFMERRSPKFDSGDEAAMRANYAGNVTLIDQQIGEVLQVVEKRGELDRTVIAFTSDHGEMNGDWGLIYKQNFLNGAVAVPLIVRTPETAANGGRVNDSPAENCDVGPTLVELAGGEIEYRQFAKSLVPAMNGSTVPYREDAISELRQEVMLADANWKVAINSDGRVYLLFDLENDADETVNLAGFPDYREVEDRLRLRILERIARSQLTAP